VSLSGLATAAPTGASSTRWTVYDDQTPLMDFNGAGQLQARYLSMPGAIDELLARQTSSGVAWYLDDRLGSVRDLIDNTGVVLDHIDYTAYGQASDSAPPQGDRFKYAGMEFDAAIGLYYDRARYYDPAAGRFIGPDPTGFSAGDANLDRYVGNEPTGLVDPTGLAGRPPGGWNWPWLDGTRAAGWSVVNNVCLGVPNLIAETPENLDNNFRDNQDRAWQNAAPDSNFDASGGSGASFPNGGQPLSPGLANNLETAAELGGAATTPFGPAITPRPGKPFTPKGKKQISDENKGRHGGVETCNDCYTPTVPGKRHQKDVTPPANERQYDHKEPKSKGGSGTPDNGQILCRKCNRAKSDH